MFAPVETIQSMNPASMSGTKQDMPRPAGVSAPLSARPTVASGASILRTKSWHPSRIRPPLYDRKTWSITSASGAFGTSAGGLIRRCEIRWSRGVVSLIPLMIGIPSSQRVAAVLHRQVHRSLELMRLVHGEDHLERGAAVMDAAERLAVLFDRVDQVRGDETV